MPDANVPVRFTLDGPARIVSPPIANSENDGVATMLLQSGTRPGTITVSASAAGLTSAAVEVVSDLADKQ